MIPEYVIDQILSKDIVSIIGGEGVSLKRAGVNYECCCPFHKEKTPSFKVSPVKGIFTCFGCSAKGNAISFVMMLYNMTFPEAVEYLAKKLNIEYKAEELTPEQKEARFRRSRIFEINQIALEYFRESYKQSLPAQKYATKERGFKEETIDNMLIGFAPYKGGFREYATQKMCIRDRLRTSAGKAPWSTSKAMSTGSFSKRRFPPPTIWTTSVSYTHLDVYKRQRHNRSKRSCVTSSASSAQSSRLCA